MAKRAVIGRVTALAVSGSSLFAAFAGTREGVFLSTNNGKTWQRVKQVPTDKTVRALAVIGPNLFAATFDQVFLSTDNGGSWQQLNARTTDLQVTALAGSGSSLFARTWRGRVFLSTDNGQNWQGGQLILNNRTMEGGLTTLLSWAQAFC